MSRCAFVTSGPKSAEGSVEGPTFRLSTRGIELVQERFRGALADRHGDGDGHAALSGRAVAGADQGVDGLVHVGVGHDDHVVLGAAEALRALARRRGAGIDVLGDRGGADEADGRMSGSSRIASTASLSPLTTLRMPAGRPASVISSASRIGTARIALGRLQDEGVADGDRRRKLPQRDHGREVERRDAGDDAEGLAEGVDVDAGPGALGVLALLEMGDAGAELDDLDAALDVALGVGDGLAVLAGEEIGERIHFLRDEVEEACIMTRARRCGLVAAQAGCAFFAVSTA